MRLSLLLLLAAAVAVAANASAGASSGDRTLELRYPRATAVPAGSRYLKAPATLAWRGDQSNLAASSDTMYVGTSTGIQRIDSSSNRFGAPLIANTEAADIGYSDGLIWASDYDDDIVRAVDASTGNVVRTVQLPSGSSPTGVAVAAGAVWVGEHHGGAIARIDPTTGTIDAQITVGLAGSSGPQAIVYGAGSLWVSVPNVSEVVRIDPGANRVTAKIKVPNGLSPCGGIAVGRTVAWVTSCLDSTWVAKISLTTNAVVEEIDLHGRSIQPVTQADTAWFLVGRDPDNPAVARQHAYLVQLSAGDRVLHRYDLGSRFTPGGTVIAFGSLWASSFTTPWVARIPLG